LGGDRIEQFGRRGQTQIQHFTQKGAGHPQASRDIMGAIEMRIHDEAFPTHGGAGFLEIYPHHDHDTVGNFRRQRGQTTGVFPAGRKIMNRARADNQ
jgi:hypothetical protein